MLFLTTTLVVLVVLFFGNKVIAKKLNYSIFLAFGISVILFYASLFMSYQEIGRKWWFWESTDRRIVGETDLYKPIATGGFPIKAFGYSVPPMGSDEPPIEAWPLFFANMAIWFVAGNIIVAFLPKKYFNSKKAENIILAVFLLSGLVIIYGLFYVLLKFD